MQRKAVSVQVVMLGITMALGMLLKSEAFTNVRFFHRNIAMLTLVATLVSAIIIVSQNAPRPAVILVVASFLATLSASVGGNLTRTSNQSFGYSLMVVSFVVAIITSVAALAYLFRTPVETA